MANIAVIESFNNNLSKVLMNVNFGDNMYPRISEKTQINLTFKFGLGRDETVLFYRDSGVIFKKYTLVLSDKSVYYKDDNKQIRTFMWKDVIDVKYETMIGHPEYVDFCFSTNQGEHVIFMVEFGIIGKEEVDKYVVPVVNGLKQLAILARENNGQSFSNQSRSPLLSKLKK